MYVPYAGRGSSFREFDSKPVVLLHVPLINTAGLGSSSKSVVLNVLG